VRGRVRVDRRLGRGLVVAAVLLVLATGWRSLRVVQAWPGDGAAVTQVAVDRLDGGLRLSPEPSIPGAFAVRPLRRGAVDVLVPGGALEVAGHRLRLPAGASAAEAEVLRRDWSVFAPETRCGHRRIDFGDDPLGTRDGVRDRVVLPSDEPAGWFHLVPDHPDRDCFRFDDRGAVLVVERAGLRLRVGERSRALEVGDRVPVRRSFAVISDEPEMTVQVAWRDVARARPVVRDGAVVGYRDERGVDLVVGSARPAEGRERAPVLEIALADEVLDRVELDRERPTILFGRRDRVSALRGRVLPARAPNEELESAVQAGLATGWIAPAAGRTAVDVPDDLPRGTARSLVGLIERWDRARAPVGLRLDGVVAAAGTAEGRRGRVPLRWDDDLEAWVPSHRPFAGGPVEFRLPVAPGTTTVTVAAAFPLAWSTADAWTSLPAPPLGRWAEHRVPVDGGVLRLRLDARPPPEHRRERLSVSLAGGPDGTALGDVRAGRRAFDGWERGESATRAWDVVPGDRWAASTEAPAPSERARPGFLHVPVSAERGGWIALDLGLPGPARSAWWNGAPVALDRLPSAPEGETTRVSLETSRGPNILTLRFDQLPTAPAREAGGVRFAVHDDGRVRALDARVADRRARPPVLSPSAVDGRPTLAALVVESGVPGLEADSVWRPGASAELLFPADSEVLRNIYGSLELADPSATLEWRNGPALALGVVRRVDTDPEGPPLAGYRVAPGAPQPLVADGDAIVGPVFRAELRATVPGELGGDVIVVAHGRRRQLVTSGDPAWAEASHGRIALRTVGGRLQVRSNLPGALWTRVGDRRELEDRWTPWPEGARAAWRLPEGTLRLLHARRPAPELPGDTFELPLQLAAESVLTRVVGDRGLGDGDPLSLRAAVIAMDAVTGDVLACASRERPGADPRTRASSPCWQDVGLHPGSTFKVGVATAALASDDPSVRRMLDGRLPDGLTAGGPRAQLRGARLPPLPLLADSRGRVLRSRLKNHRRALMPSDATLEDALRSSLNTWFGYTGLLLHRPLREGWGDAGIADPTRLREGWPVAQVAHTAGFGRRIDLGAGHTGTGGRFPLTSVEGDAPLAARAIGQGDVTATPLGVAALLAPAVADGWSVVPRVSTDRPVRRERVLTSGAALRLRDGLRQVVRKGTASRAFSDHPQRHLLLGKTGSAQRVSSDGVSRTDAWFAGAVVPPADQEGNPVVFVAVIPGGGLGGRTAAEVVDALSRELIALRGWDPPPSS